MRVGMDTGEKREEVGEKKIALVLSWSFVVAVEEYC
jgi:hypothetical protein